MKDTYEEIIVPCSGHDGAGKETGKGLRVFDRPTEQKACLLEAREKRLEILALGLRCTEVGLRGHHPGKRCAHLESQCKVQERNTSGFDKGEPPRDW